MKYDKQRLFEVTARLDKSFKPKLNEELELDAEVSAEEPAMDVDAAVDAVEEPVEKSPEEKLAELTTKVDELHAMLHGEEAEVDAPAEEVPAEPEAGEEEEVEVEDMLQEDHLKDRESQVKFICKNDKDCKKEDLEDLSDEEVKKKYLATEKKMGLDEAEEVPVAAVAKVGEAK